jgi:HEAT repeat protein
MHVSRFLGRTGLVLIPVLFVSAARTPAHAGSRPHTAVAAADKLPDRLPRAAWAADDPADSLYRAAREALIDGDFRRAAGMFGEIGTRFPKSTYAADALYYRAYALYRLGGESELRAALSALDEEQSRFPTAGTINDAKELAIRIRGSLAQRGDVNSAVAVTTAATTKCTNGNGSGGDRGDDIRSEAMNALLQMDAQSAVPIIKAVLQKRDDCSVSLRKRAVFLLSQKETGETVGLLIDAIRNDPSPVVRQEAVFWLGQVHSDQAAAALEEIATRSGDARLRDKAVFALGQQGSPRATAVVRRLAESGDTPRKVREQAIFQLGQKHSAENAEFLRSLFAKLAKEDDELRKNVLFSLSQMRGMGNDRWLLKLALDQSQTVELRKHALWTAGQAGIPGSELVSLYDQMPDRPLREQLIWVLSESRDPAASAKLVEIAQRDKDPEMRKKAIFWLGQKNDPRIRQILLDILTKG